MMACCHDVSENTCFTTANQGAVNSVVNAYCRLLQLRSQWAYTITQALKELEVEGVKLKPELLASFSPYRTSRLNRFGLIELKERYPPPVDYSV